MNPSETPAAKWRANLWRWSQQIVVVILFLGSLYWGVTQFLSRHWIRGPLVVCLGIATIPWADPSLPVRERIRGSLVLIFVFAGMVLSIAGYFLMFYFEWFERIFNNKGGGEFGLMLSVFLGIGGGGYLGVKTVAKLLGPESFQLPTETNHP